MLQKQKGSLSSFNIEVLLNFWSLFPTKWWISQYHIISVLLLNIPYVFAKRIGVNNIGCFNAMQYHVHDPNNICKVLFLLAIKGFGLKYF